MKLKQIKSQITKEEAYNNAINYYLIQLFTNIENESKKGECRYSTYLRNFKDGIDKYIVDYLRQFTDYEVVIEDVECINNEKIIIIKWGEC